MKKKKEVPVTPSLRVSVVLPTYNEKEIIAEAIQRVSDIVGHDLHEIVIIDDNSPDETWRIAQEVGHPKVRVIRRIDERGLASALARGVREAQGDIVTWLDCDMGVPPEIVLQLLEAIKEHDVAIASRYIPGGGDPRPPLRSFLSNLLNTYGQLLYGKTVTDYTSGVAAVRKEVIPQILWKDNGFGEYFAEFSWRCIVNKLKVKEVPVVYVPRRGGVSKSDGSSLTLLKYGIQYGWKMLKWRVTIR